MPTGQSDGGNCSCKSSSSHVCSGLYQFDENYNIVPLVYVDIKVSDNLSFTSLQDLMLILQNKTVIVQFLKSHSL